MSYSDKEKKHKLRQISARMTLCVDFDGCLHQYVSGWQGSDVVADPPVPGALEWLRLVVDEGFKVCIYSSRSREAVGIKTMREWLVKHGLEELYLEYIEFPTQKPNAFLIIDDRAFHFQGTFPTPEWIRNFKVWNYDEQQRRR